MTIRFYDVSHYQGSFHPAGPTIAKATEGTSFVDVQYIATRDRTLAGGWPFAGYHFLDALATAAAQAKHAYSVIGKTPAMLDVETGVNGNPTLKLITGFIDAYRKLGGVMNLIYLPKWYWRDHLGGVSLKPLKDRGLVLISSQYTTYSEAGPGWDAYGGMTPEIWQFTLTPIDTNAFKGTQDQLAALFATGTTEGEDDMATEVVIPEGYGDDTGKTIDAGAALASIMRYVLDGRNEAKSADSKADKALTALADLAAKVAALPTTAAPAGPLSDDDVKRIAAAVVDLQAARLES